MRLSGSRTGNRERDNGTNDPERGNADVPTGTAARHNMKRGLVRPLTTAQEHSRTPLCMLSPNGRGFERQGSASRVRNGSMDMANADKETRWWVTEMQAMQTHDAR